MSQISGMTRRPPSSRAIWSHACCGQIADNLLRVDVRKHCPPAPGLRMSKPQPFAATSGPPGACVPDMRFHESQSPAAVLAMYTGPASGVYVLARIGHTMPRSSMETPCARLSPGDSSGLLTRVPRWWLVGGYGIHFSQACQDGQGLAPEPVQDRRFST